MTELNNINDVVGLLDTEMSLNKSTPPEVPTPLILGGAVNKSGLSVRDIVKKIIQRKSEIGIPVGNLPDGSESLDEKMLYVIVETIVEAFIENAKISIAIPAGIGLTASGGNAGGAVQVVGMTTSIVRGVGIIQ